MWAPGNLAVVLRRHCEGEVIFPAHPAFEHDPNLLKFCGINGNRQRTTAAGVANRVITVRDMAGFP